MILLFHGKELARGFGGIDRDVVKEFCRGIGDNIPKVCLGIKSILLKNRGIILQMKKKFRGENFNMTILSC